MPVSYQYKCIFVHIPKTAGTSVEHALGLHGDKTSIGLERYWNQQGQKENLFGGEYQHLTLPEIKRILPRNIFQNFFRFTIIRNPWDRLVSHFAWKDGKWARKEELSKDDFENSLYQFYERYRQNKMLTDRMKNWYRASSIYQGNLNVWEHRHLIPQYWYIHNYFKQSELDYIGRFENLEETWQSICRQLKTELPLEQRMVSIRKNYREYYSKKSKRIVEEIYQRDIHKFSYNF